MANMAMNRVWNEKDYMALVRRVAFAHGSISAQGKKAEDEELAKAQAALAATCKVFLDTYERKIKNS